MEFYRIENSGQLKKGMFSVPEPDVKQYPLSSLQRMGRHGFLSPVLHSTKRGCGSDTEEDFTIVPEAERKSAQDRNCVWRTDRQKNSNGNT